MYTTKELLKEIEKLVSIYEVWSLFDEYDPERYKDEKNLIWSKCSINCKEQDFERIYFMLFFMNEYNRLDGNNGSFCYDKKNYENNINVSSLKFYSHILEELLCDFPVEIYKFRDEMKIIFPNKEEKIIKLTVDFVEEAKNHIEQYLTVFFDDIKSEPIKENISKKWDIFVKNYVSKDSLDQNIKAYIDKSLTNFEMIRNNSFHYLIEINNETILTIKQKNSFSDIDWCLRNEFMVILEKEGLNKKIKHNKESSVNYRL